MSYIDDALRTESTNYHMVSREQAILRIADAIFTLEKLDELKKAVFYGKNVEKLRQIPGRGLELLDQKDRQLFHSIIGIATEAGELLQAFLTHLETGQPYDETNLKEEMGDVMWYQALGLNALNTTFGAEQVRNIRKLRKRFPEKFTEDLAIHRQVEDERLVLKA